MDKKVKNLVLAGVFAAVIFVATAFLSFKIPMLSTGAYVHIGDAFIYLAASVLSMPYAIAAASIGAGLADAFAAPIYIIPTIIIKALMAACFTSKSKKMLCKRNIAAIFFAGIICTVGYYITEVILLSGNFMAPLMAVPMGLIQPVASGILYAVIAAFAGNKRLV